VTSPGALPRLGVIPPQFSASARPALEVLDQVAGLGFDGVFVYDHLWPLGGRRDGPFLEGWTLLGALAARAGRWAGPPLRLGTLVTRAGLRPPALVARMAATAGQAAGAPVIAGVGGGDKLNRDENLAYGLPYLDLAGRVAATAELLDALRGPAAGQPRPVTWTGGRGRSMQELAGRAADGWNVWGATPDEVAAGLAVARQAAGAAGRDPLAVEASWGGQVLCDLDAGRARARLHEWASGRNPDEAARTLAGTPDEILARLAGFRAAGAAWCVLSLVGGSGPEVWETLATAAGLTARPPGGPRD
jgi:alkanesulfonate monooxygenase SsuD/methylene tetrahydromethanopterin reductase-like flavin-dependent oxidoreductase (luciferase family)